MNARAILLFLTLICCATAGVSTLFYYRHSHQLALQENLQDARRSAELLAGRLDAYLLSQQRAVKSLAALPGIKHYSLSQAVAPTDQVSYLLNLTCDTQQASLCYLLNRDGTTTAQNRVESLQLLGNNYGFRPYFTDAISEGSSLYAAHGVTTLKRGLYFGHRIEAESAMHSGVAVIKVDVDFLDREWVKLEGTTVLVDPDGVIFASSRPAWIFHTLWPLPAQELQHKWASQQFAGPLESLGFREPDPQGILLSAQGDARYLLGTAAVPALPGWQVYHLVDTRTLPFLSASDRSVLLAMLLLFGLGSVTVITLYRIGSRDILRRREMERELQQSETRLRQLGEISNEGIVIHEKGRIIDCNQAAERMFGYRYAELVQMEVWSLLVQESIAPCFEKIHSGYTKPYQVVARRQDGTEFPMEIFAKESTLQGRTVRVSCLRDITLFKEQEQLIRYQTEYDQLTGLPNRELLLARLQSVLDGARPAQDGVAVCYIDLDDFKKINDSLGHRVGNQLLVEAARRLSTQQRPGDTLARLGGDEFVLLLTELQAEADLPQRLEQILQVMAQDFLIDAHPFFISITAGIALHPTDGIDAETLLQHAETAMYRCKEAIGRNAYGFYQASMNEDVAARVTMEAELRQALEREELSLHYQPIYSVDGRRLLSAEALLRWHSATLGYVRPDRFIGLAEQTGLIIPIGDWVLRTACRQLQQWLGQGLSGFRISVNISPRQLQASGFIERLRDLLHEAALPAGSLVFEVTEGLLVRNDSATAGLLDEIKRLGVLLAMDDFGTGYSSLAYLKDFPFDILKIDRSFVRDLADDPGDQQLVAATIALSRGLHLQVVAEGVETETQLRFLQQAGCDAVQGFLLGRPMPAEHFAAVAITPLVGGDQRLPLQPASS